MRDALTKYPDASYFWYLDQDAFIMNPSVPVHEQVMSDAKFEEVMIKDHPFVPPDSIIKAFAHLRGHDVDLVITQDKEGLSSGSFLLRNSEWSIFFLETWFDPIYRSYNFQKAEAHALVGFFVAGQDGDSALTAPPLHRNTSCSGIPPSSPSWPWCPSA